LFTSGAQPDTRPPDAPARAVRRRSAARDDERSIAASDLAADYARYKQRAGMFFPRLWRKAVG
jgi:hypothetical protein